MTQETESGAAPAGPSDGFTVPIGYRVAGWEVTGPLGAGSWGSVYAACRPGEAGTPVEAALKFFATVNLAPREAAHLTETAQREVDFFRHGGGAGLIGVLDTVVVDDPDRPELDGVVVLVLERAARSLQDVLDAAYGDVPDAAGRWAVEICEALAELHKAGWVHGDLKPANVLLMADDSVRLADFGLISQLEGTHGYAPPLGSPDYLPPERRSAPLTVRGVPVRASGDVWSLGVTLHQLLTGGAMPFPGGSAAARIAAAHEYVAGRAVLRLDPALPEPWRPVIQDCLAADPLDRDRHDAQQLTIRARAALAATASDGTGRRRGRAAVRIRLAAAAVAVVAACTTFWWTAESGSQHGTPLAQTATVTVYNVEGNCSTLKEKLPSCSMGLALDPRKPYDGHNVVAHRVWHGDVLTADCVLHDAVQVADENGVETTRWFRVVVPDGPQRIAWLPAVRTRDNPPLPACVL